MRYLGTFKRLRTSRTNSLNRTLRTLRYTSSQLAICWSVRVGLHYRALGVSAPDGIVWFWLGSHTEYERLIRA